MGHVRLTSYQIHKVLPPATIYPCASLKVRKGHKKVNSELVCNFDVENIPIQLNDTGVATHCLPIQALTIPL